MDRTAMGVHDSVAKHIAVLHTKLKLNRIYGQV